MERLQLRLTTAGRESSAVAQALKAMGINAQQFQALSIPQQMERLAEAASEADGAGKTAARPRARPQLRLLARRCSISGKEGLDELREAAQASGAAMSTEVAESFRAHQRGHKRTVARCDRLLQPALFERQPGGRRHGQISRPDARGGQSRRARQRPQRICGGSRPPDQERRRIRVRRNRLAR